MDSLGKFSDYDFFAYLATGFAAFAVWDVVFGTTRLLNADWSVPEAVLTVLVTYVAGQILASPSAWLIERRFVGGYLKRPSVWLLGVAKPSVFRRFLFRDYYTPLPEGIRRKVFVRGESEDAADLTGEELFWYAFAHAKCNPQTYARMSTFLRLYGFCRNIAFVGYLGVVLTLARFVSEVIKFGWPAHPGRLLFSALVMLFVGVGMTHRYLKFFRLYSVEVFVDYATSPVGVPARE